MTMTVQETTTVGGDVVPSVTLGGWQLREALASAVIAAGTDATLPTIAGVLMEWGPGPVTFAGTDRYRLIMVETETTGDGAARVILPRDAVVELVKALPKRGARAREWDDVAVVVTVTSGAVTFRASGPDVAWSREVRAVEGDFPRYRSLMPGIDGVDMGAAPVEGMAWNPHYMADFAKLPMLGKGDPIRWTFRGESKPLVAVVEGRHGTTVRCLLMPVRLTS